MDTDIRETGLSGDPRRQAVNALRGYVYQLWHTVSAWIDLKDQEVLFLERSEDFDIVGPDIGTVVQVKDTASNITLRKPAVIDAICHYWQLRRAHPQLKIYFRFLTRSPIGVEIGQPFGPGIAGLDLWKKCGRNPDLIEPLRRFLYDEDRIHPDLPDLKDLLRSADSMTILKELILPISWETEQEGSSFVEKAIEKKLILHGEKWGIPPSESASVVDRLLKEVINTACRPDDRSLDRSRFLALFEESTTTRISHQQLQKFMRNALPPTELMTPLLGGQPAFSLQTAHLIQKNIPPLNANMAPRETQVAKFRAILRETGILVLTGSAGMGKTTVAKLIAQAGGGEWIWASLSGLDHAQIGQTLNYLQTTLEEVQHSPKVLLDDIDFSPAVARHYEDLLGSLIFNLVERNGEIIITGQKSIPERLSRGIGLDAKSTQIISPFDQNEIANYLVQMGCPTDGRERNWTKVLLLQTGGHTQLIHARVINLIETKWPDVKIDDLYKTPGDVQREREQARQLLVDRSQDQRELLYRLSIISGFFRRDHAINMGDEITPPIPHSGDVLDALIGPWIERVGGNYYRLSPLLQDAAKQVWSETQIRDFQVATAKVIIKCGRLSTLEASNALFLAWCGRSANVFLNIIASLMAAPLSLWKSLASDLSWLTSIRPEVRNALFPENRPVQFMLGLLQFKIAAYAEPDRAPQIMEALNQESIAPYEPRKLFLGNRLLFIIQVLFSDQVEVSYKNLVAFLSETAEIEKEFEEFRALTTHFSLPMEISESESARDYLSIMFWAFIIPRCTNVGYLDDLIESLSDAPEEIRRRLLAGFNILEDTAVFMIDRVWFQESKKEHPIWGKCLRSLEKTFELAHAWGAPTLASAAANAMALIYDEYLNDPSHSISTLDAASIKVGPSILLKDRRADVLFHQGSYSEAVGIWEEILPLWQPSANTYPTYIFSYRLAGIASAENGNWKKAGQFFLEGSSRSYALKNIILSAAYLGDAAWALWRARDYKESIKIYAKALRTLEQSPDPGQDFGSFWVSKILGNALLWIKLEIAGESHTNAEPRPGMCSDPERSEKVKKLPPTPIDFSWLHLIQIEYDLQIGTELYEEIAGRIERSSFPVIRLFKVELEILQAIRHLQLDLFPMQIRRFEKEFRATQAHNIQGMEVWESPVSSNQEISTSGISIVGHDPFIVALLALINAGKDISTQIDRWINNAQQITDNQEMLEWLANANSILAKETRESLSIMEDMQRGREDRLLAAVRVVMNDSVAVDDLFYAQMMIFRGLVQTGWAKRIAKPFLDLLTKQWQTKIHLRAVLRSPNLTVPQIQAACNSSLSGLQKIAEILLAASNAVSVRLPISVYDELRRCASGNS